MAEVAVYCWYHVYVACDACDCSEEVNCGLKTACEESGAGEE